MVEYDKFVSDVAISTVRISTSIFRGVLIIPVITKFLGPDSYGIWVSIEAVVGIISVVGGLHLKGALIRYSHQEDARGQTLVDVLSIAVMSALLFGGSYFVFTTFVTIFPHSVQTPELVAGTALLIGLYIISHVIINYPRANGDVKNYEVVSMGKIVLETVAVILVLWLTRSILAGVWTLVIIYILVNVGLLIRYLPRPFLLPDRSSFSTYLRYSFPMVPKEIGTKIISNVDRYLLLYFLSPTAAGIYAVCFAVANILRNLTMVLNPTLYPTVTSAWDEGDVAMIRDLYYKIYKWYSLLAVPSLAGLTVLSGPILEILATAKVAASGQLVLPVLALGFFIRGYNNPLAYILNAAEQNKKLANATLIAAVVNLGLNLTLIQTVGIFGAVTATLVSYTLLTGYVFLEVRKKVAFPLPITSFLKAVIGTLVMSAVLVSLPFTLSPWECLVVYPIIGVSVYGSIIIKLEGITKRDLRYFVAQFVGE